MMIIIMIMIINNKNKVIKLKPKNNSSDVLRYKKTIYDWTGHQIDHKT